MPLREGVEQSGEEASFALRGVVTALSAAQSWVEQVTHRIAEHVETVNGNSQGKTRPAERDTTGMRAFLMMRVALTP